ARSGSPTGAPSWRIWTRSAFCTDQYTSTTSPMAALSDAAPLVSPCLRKPVAEASKAGTGAAAGAVSGVAAAADGASPATRSSVGLPNIFGADEASAGAASAGALSSELALSAAIRPPGGALLLRAPGDQDSAQENYPRRFFLKKSMVRCHASVAAALS